MIVFAIFLGVYILGVIVCLCLTIFDCCTSKQTNADVDHSVIIDSVYGIIIIWRRIICNEKSPVKIAILSFLFL